MVIAIDGPAGAGKSSVAKAVAQALGFTYLDSGAMYRCVALASLRATAAAATTTAATATATTGEAVADQPSVDQTAAALAQTLEIALGERVRLNGEDVTDAIRDPEVSRRASEVAADSDVRAALVAKQQQLLRSGNWVAEGRDIGTVVAPHAELKIFLTADPLERARRRAAQLGVAVEGVLAEQNERDERDLNRIASPLAAASDATHLDTTGLTLEQVVSKISQLADQRRAPIN